MSKRVLILSSSPRKKGNSNALCDQFMEGAVEAKHKVEKVVLAEKKINYCTGCYTCRENGKCAQKDDMAQILDSMIAADVIVMATPVYFYTMCAQMKTVIDRCVERYTKIANKEFYSNRENPRLCRGGSSSLTFPGVHPETLRREPPSTRKGETGWTSMTA
jgi:multimeric flavodoxin WrbA